MRLGAWRVCGFRIEGLGLEGLGFRIKGWGSGVSLDRLNISFYRDHTSTMKDCDSSVQDLRGPGPRFER